LKGNFNPDWAIENNGLVSRVIIQYKRESVLIFVLKFVYLCTYFLWMKIIEVCGIIKKREKREKKKRK
jgi:hypothetical protein